MISFEKITLTNGLSVLVNYDPSTPMMAMNILYKVGARNENPGKTGFAHLFEHLMFGGSVNIPSYDEPLQRAGGENNAFTNNDITNYYLTIPAQNAETAFWLESDRMLSLAFTEKSLEVQRQVVIEEFRQRYLNQPYGDAWLKLRPLAYQVHPYRWATIGREISHIENATLQDVKDFFFRYYHPGNAILTLSGNIKPGDAFRLAEKWFGPIPSREMVSDQIDPEPPQTKKRILETDGNVPYHAIYKAWHCGGRRDPDFYTNDLMTDILSSGKSSRLYNTLVKERRIFSSLNAYLLGDLDPSLVVAEGKLYEGIDPEKAEHELNTELQKLCDQGVNKNELEKVHNKSVSTTVFGNMQHETRAMNLAYFEMLGDAAEINLQEEKIRSVTEDNIQNNARRIFREENSSSLIYRSKTLAYAY
jgi:zinc protease